MTWQYNTVSPYHVPHHPYSNFPGHYPLNYYGKCFRLSNNGRQMVENLVLKDFQSISKLGKFLFPVIPLEDKNLLSTGIANLYGYIILIYRGLFKYIFLLFPFLFILFFTFEIL